MSVKKLQELFIGLDRAHGTYAIDDSIEGEKVSGEAKTIATAPTEEMWQQHLDGTRSLGIIPICDDGTVRWAALDVDSYGTNVCATVNQFIKEHAIPFVVCRSKSGGAHVYVFFSEKIKATEVVKKLREFAKSMGYDGTEIFPKQIKLEEGQYGNWLNMPYFQADITLRYAINRDGEQLDLDEFLALAKRNSLSRKQFRDLKVPTLEHPFADGPPCCQHFSREGVSEGGRNAALLQMGVYAKIVNPDEYEDMVVEYNDKYINPPLPMRELTSTIFKSLGRRDYGYLCTQAPMAQVCNRPVCMRRKHGVGGAIEERFEMDIDLQDLKKLVYMTPTGKVIDEPPEWEITVRGHVLRYENVSHLMEQKKFGAQCIEKVNFYPQIIPQARWRNVIQNALDSCQTIEIPFELSPQSQTLEHLKDYLKQMSHAKNNAQLIDGLAMKVDGVYRFRLESLVDFIREKTRLTINPKIIGKHLDAFDMRRDRTTIRIGTDTIGLVYWEADAATLRVESTDELEPTKSAPDVNF
jgi:hypothetical protein